MKYGVFLCSLFCSLAFTSSYAIAAELNFEYLDQQGEDIQLFIDFDDITYPNPSVSYSQNAEDDGVALVSNDFLGGNHNFSLQASAPCSGEVLDCMQPNQTYIYTFIDTGDTFTFTTNFNGIPDFIPQPPPADGNIWAGGSIFGSTTSGDLLASVTTGVQDSGLNIWPLFALVGVAIAFVIAGLLVNFINQSIADSRRTKKINEYVENGRLDLLKRDYVIDLRDAKKRGQARRVIDEYQKAISTVANKKDA